MASIPGLFLKESRAMISLSLLALRDSGAANYDTQQCVCV